MLLCDNLGFLRPLNERSKTSSGEPHARDILSARVRVECAPRSLSRWRRSSPKSSSSPPPLPLRRGLLPVASSKPSREGGVAHKRRKFRRSSPPTRQRRRLPRLPPSSGSGGDRDDAEKATRRGESFLLRPPEFSPVVRLSARSIHRKR